MNDLLSFARTQEKHTHTHTDTHTHTNTPQIHMDNTHAEMHRLTTDAQQGAAPRPHNYTNTRTGARARTPSAPTNLHSKKRQRSRLRTRTRLRSLVHATEALTGGPRNSGSVLDVGASEETTGKTSSSRRGMGGQDGRRRSRQLFVHCPVGRLCQKYPF